MAKNDDDDKDFFKKLEEAFCKSFVIDVCQKSGWVTTLAYDQGLEVTIPVTIFKKTRNKGGKK